MARIGEIITVGLSPAWDVTCRGENLDWGRHKVVIATSRPAGKALNISRALCWVGAKSTACGLWGRIDYRQMLDAVRGLQKLVRIKVTTVEGRSRQNLTIIDTARNRELHLRSESGLASRKALRKLSTDLRRIVKKGDVSVFAGATPYGRLVADVLNVINSCRRRGAKIAVDTSGQALKKIVGAGGLWLIKPNVDELAELLGRKIADNAAELANAGRTLLGKCELVLVSRGENGAVLVSKEGAWQGRFAGKGRKVLSTVACGDFLLAGFLNGFKQTRNPAAALEKAIICATAKAWDWAETKRWPDAVRQIKVKVERLAVWTG